MFENDIKTKDLPLLFKGAANILPRKQIIQATNHDYFLIMLEPAAARQKRKSASEKTGTVTNYTLALIILHKNQSSSTSVTWKIIGN